MKGFLERVIAQRAAEQCATDPYVKHMQDIGPYEVDQKRYKIHTGFVTCRWCGKLKRGRSVGATCRFCNNKTRPCPDCGGPVGRTRKGIFCGDCDSLMSMDYARHVATGATSGRGRDYNREQTKEKKNGRSESRGRGARRVRRSDNAEASIKLLRRRSRLRSNWSHDGGGLS